MIRNAIVIASTMLLFGCDNVTKNYATHSDAKNDHLFERGWLPTIIPESSCQITTINNLDVNTSHGSFTFSTNDFHSFTSKLQSLNDAAFDHDLCDEGYLPYEFKNETSLWVFLIHPKTGHCEYDMNLTK